MALYAPYIVAGVFRSTFLVYICSRDWTEHGSSLALASKPEDVSHTVQIAVFPANGAYLEVTLGLFVSTLPKLTYNLG